MPNIADSSPSSNVVPLVPKKVSTYHALLALSQEDRRELLAQFCRDCGSDDPRCQCWRVDR